MSASASGVQNFGEAEAYVVTFLSKLLYQREKIELGLLDEVLQHDIKDAWHDFLITVECNRRYHLFHATYNVKKSRFLEKSIVISVIFSDIAALSGQIKLFIHHQSHRVSSVECPSSIVNCPSSYIECPSSVHRVTSSVHRVSIE